MASSGYDPDRFVGNDHEAFGCLICTNVAREPFQCHGCGKMTCKACITGWISKGPAQKCPNRCNNTDIVPISSKALLRMYKDLNIKCINSKCQKVLKLSDIDQHQLNCLMTKCWNFQVCEKPQTKGLNKNKACCSLVCSALIEIKDKFNDKKGLYEAIGNFIKQSRSYYPVQGGLVNPIVQPIYNPNSLSTGLIWDSAKTGGGITITQNGAHCFLKEQSYLFRTTLANQGFMSGVHYWEILADNRTQNELKIGVATMKDFDYNSAFCDHPFGFAYYGLGQLRHNSNASGPSYGKKFKKEGTLGVCLNMNTGVLAFSLNGQYMGVAYKDQKLTSGPIFPAVALLHCAGCKIKSGLPVPNYFKD